jgi:hypothetical protein
VKTKSLEAFAQAGVEDAEVVPGLLPATDPFFSFITQGGGIRNFVNPILPSQILRTVKLKDLKYTFHDRVSREPSFELLGDDEYECKCHQVTDLHQYHQPRERITMPAEYVDDVGLILGDSWWPGVVGSRFIYEVSTPNPDFFLAEGTVPCAQLLFVYTARKQKKGEMQGADKLMTSLEERADDDESDDEVEAKQTDEEEKAKRAPKPIHAWGTDEIREHPGMMRRIMSLPIPIPAFV